MIFSYFQRMPNQPNRQAVIDTIHEFCRAFGLRDWTAEWLSLNLLGFVGQHLETQHQAPMAGLLLVRRKLAVGDHVHGKVG